MATLLNAVSTDTVGTGAAITGPCIVLMSGSMGGGFVRIDMSSTDGNYRTIEVKRDQQPFVVDAEGAYYLRATLKDSASPSLTVVTVP